MNKLYKNFIFDIVAGSVALALAIIMIPPLNFGIRAINILLAIGLLAYAAVFRFDSLRKMKGTLFILSVAEMALIGVVSVFLVLQEFEVVANIGVCSAIGFVLWLRSVVSLVGMYLTSPNAKTKYSLPLFSLYLALASLGMFLFAKPFISNVAIAWIAFALLIAVALIFAGLAVLYAPAKKK